MTNVTVTRHTTATLTIKEIDVTFEIESHFAPDDPDTVQWAPREGGGFTIGWLCDDDDNGGDFWTDIRDNDGTYREFVRDEDPNVWLAEARAEHGADRVFIVERYSHGLEHYSIAGTVDYPDRQWDVGAVAMYICPADCPEPAEYAKATIAEYSEWCAGNVYGVVTRIIDADGNLSTDPTDAQECWGFIGYDHATQSLKEDVNHGGLQ